MRRNISLSRFAKFLYFGILYTFFLNIVCHAEETFHGFNGYIINYNLEKGYGSLSAGVGKTFPSFYSAYIFHGDTIRSSDYTERFSERFSVNDSVYGKGNCLRVINRKKGLPDFIQIFISFKKSNFLFLRIELFSDSEIEVNFLAPFIADQFIKDTTKISRYSKLFIPFDNDKWIKFDFLPIVDSTRNESYEVGAIVDHLTGSCWIAGSVEHNLWKSALHISVDGNKNKYMFYSGASSGFTRDVIPHGKVRGKKICSPGVLIGYFENWKDGMEIYADANSRLNPPLSWQYGTPFGWNSWGSIQTKINYQKAVEVSDYFASELQQGNFKNDNVVYIGLDSYWDKLSDSELEQFVLHCKKNNQKAGIYWAPFADWHKNPKRKVEGTSVLYEEVYLYADGKPQDLDGAYAVDPTHPAVERRTDYFTGRFKKAGFEYIKIDFLTHGALEADSHYDRNITTGIQAYNRGMDYFLKAIGESFYITMAISPLFPYQYAHSRRIACDAFASISDTEYTLNGLSYGWWLNKVYRYNDADHIVLGGKNVSEGENRARITSGVITGIYMLGDDLSLSGNEDVKKKVISIAGNKEINDIARIGRSFRPVYGNKPSLSGRAEQFFILYDGDVTYLAIFNYNDTPYPFSVLLNEFGLSERKKYSIKELWTGKADVIQNRFENIIPGKDVHLYMISKK